MVLNLQKLEMLSNVSQINAKHGIFQYCIHDQYIGNAINEYGEFSEIELSIMNKFIKKVEESEEVVGIKFDGNNLELIIKK